MTPYYVVFRDRPAKGTFRIVRKYLKRPVEDGGLWTWTSKKQRAARFQDALQAEAYAQPYEGAECARGDA